MPTTDEIIGDLFAAAELPEGAIPTHIIVIVEYAEPGSDNSPERLRLSVISDEDLPPWTAIGMLRFAAQCEYDAVDNNPEDD